MSTIKSEYDSMNIEANEDETTCMPLVVNEEVYHESLVQGQQCFVLVDQDAVDPIHHNISSPSHQDRTTLITGHHLQTTNDNNATQDDVEDNSNDMEMGDPHKSLTIMVDEKDELDMMGIESGRTVEVVEMDDGKTVEVVQMDGGKTLEVMHVDDIEPSHQVSQFVSNVIPSSESHIHFERNRLFDSNQTEVIKGPINENISLLEQKIRTGSNILTSQISNECLNPVTMKTVYTFRNKNQLISSPLNLSTFSNPTPSITFSTGKSMYAARPAYSINTPIVVSSSLSKYNSFDIKDKIPDKLETSIDKDTSPAVTDSFTIQSLSQTVGSTEPSIVLSGGRPIMSNTLGNINNTIYISWPSSLQSDEKIPIPLNEKAVQTESLLISSSSGPSMNIFSCTFYPNCDTETQCDMPLRKHIGVGTQTVGLKRHMEIGEDFDENEGAFMEKVQINNRRKHNGCSIFTDCSERNDLSISVEVQDDDNDLEPLMMEEHKVMDQENMADHQHDIMMELPIKKRKKRGRKKKKKDPIDTMPYMEDELEFTGIQNDGDMNQEADEGGGDHEVRDVLTLRNNVYGLRTKPRLKKLTDMHYLEEKAPKKRIERSQVFHCPICEESFPTFTRLQKHAKDNHDYTTFEFPCDICGIMFTRPHNLDRHKATKHSDGEKPYVCEHCGRRFGRPDVLSVHISMVHLKTSLLNSYNSSNKKSKGPSLLGPSMVHCTSCNKFFSKEKKLKEHMSGDLSCTDCNVKFECKTSLRNHMYKDHHSSCSECGKECSNKQQMYFHRLSHSPKFFCKICKKGFLWKSTYSVHMATHTGEKTELCDICGKSFSHKVAVNKHKWQEHNENNRKFVCKTCGKAFVYKTKLASHIRSHTGEKPFMCNRCPATFSQKCNLTAHIKCVHGVYIQSMKSDGSTETQLVKYKRVKKLPVADPVIDPIMQATQLQQDHVHEQVHDIASQVQEQHVHDIGSQMQQEHVSRMTQSVHPGPSMVVTAEAEEVHDQQVHEQVHISEVMEPETAVYQIVYTYPQ